MAGMRIWYAPELTVEHNDSNLLDFRRFAIRQYHGCIGHAQFLARFPAPRGTALYAKITPPAGEKRGVGQWLRWGLHRLMATARPRFALLWGAVLCELPAAAGRGQVASLPRLHQHSNGRRVRSRPPPRLVIPPNGVIT